MKYYATLAFAAFAATFLTSCGLLDAIFATAAEPETMTKIEATVDEAEKAVASGDWSTTEVVGTSAVSTLLVGALGKWLHGRMANSGPGEIVGGKSPGS